MKKAVVVLLILVFGGFIAYKMIDEPLPQGKDGLEADIMANKMLDALNQSAYDSATTISWTYAKDNHKYLWNKLDNKVLVEWEDMEVAFSTRTFQGEGRKAGKTLEGEMLIEAIDQAWQFFANDSFWLVAPYKVFDPGTKRSVVEVSEGYGLLITYSSGGVTPGDSYLWLLDENYFPTAWKMWTQKVPIGGVEFKWTNWKEYQGFWLATDHEWLISLPMTNIEVK